MDPIRDLNEATNIALIAQNALGFAMPPFIPFRETVTVDSSLEKDADPWLQRRFENGMVENTNWVVPLCFQLDGLTDFDFPVDPIISLSSKNIITRRYVNKSTKRGSVKEHWSQDDWEITITGIIIEPDPDFMQNILLALRKYLDSSKSISVKCPVFNQMDILRIAIETYDFPFTKGVENQAFIIKAFSDEDYDLLIKN